MALFTIVHYSGECHFVLISCHSFFDIVTTHQLVTFSIVVEKCWKMSRHWKCYKSMWNELHSEKNGKSKISTSLFMHLKHNDLYSVSLFGILKYDYINFLCSFNLVSTTKYFRTPLGNSIQWQKFTQSAASGKFLLRKKPRGEF